MRDRTVRGFGLSARHKTHVTHVTPRTSHLTPHTSHLTPHTSHATLPASLVTRTASPFSGPADCPSIVYCTLRPQVVMTTLLSKLAPSSPRALSVTNTNNDNKQRQQHFTPLPALPNPYWTNETTFCRMLAKSLILACCLHRICVLHEGQVVEQGA